MNLATVKAAVTSKFARQILQTQKYSPQILFVAGSVGVVTATVLACRATLKVAEVLDHHEIDAKLIKGEYPETQAASEEMAKDLRKLQVKTGLEIVKLYAVPVGLGLASIGALTGSHVVLTKRNSAVMAAYASLDQAYKRYRERVAGEYGVDVDKKFALGGEDVNVEEKTSDGKTIVKKKTKNGSGVRSPYAVFFGDLSSKFTREPGVNSMIISTNQSWANDKLRAQGHLFLNEVHDMLGLPRTQAGAVVGWVYRKDNEEKNGDNYVDFGIYEYDTVQADLFVSGEELGVWLDPNVDGIIYNLI